MELIISQIVDHIMIRKWNNKQLLKWLSDTYGYKQSFSYRLIKRSRSRIMNMIDLSIYNFYVDNIEVLNKNYQNLMNSGKWELAFECLKEINKLRSKN